MLIIREQKIFVFIITTVFLFVGFSTDAIVKQLGGDNFLQELQGVFLAVAFTGFFIFNAHEKIFKKWLVSTSIFIVLAILIFSVHGVGVAHFNDIETTVGIFDWVYILWVIMFFFHDTIKLRQVPESEEAKEKIQKKIKFVSNLLVWSIILISFFSLFGATFWFFGTIFVGVPVFLFAGTVFALHFHELRERKWTLAISLTVILADIIFLVWALSQFTLSMA